MSSDIAKSLTRVLGNSYVLYVKTHSYHWNVTGPNFHALHNLFEEQYRQIWASLDDIAERIRALDEYAPVSARVMAEAANIKESDNGVPSSQVMLKNLVADQTLWIKDAEEALEAASEEGDTGTEDLLAPLISAHEKMRWMLKSSLAD
ncbi:Dps family protein [Parvularcula marina]|uniref:Dps family protein n=1 Tax=Parvularcula marina TaxID=2292771 RepID=UPI003518F560